MRAALFALLPLAGCAAELPLAKTIEVKGVQSIRGVSVDGDLLDLVVDERGIVQIDRDGNFVREIAQGEPTFNNYDEVYRTGQGAAAF